MIAMELFRLSVLMSAVLLPLVKPQDQSEPSSIFVSTLSAVPPPPSAPLDGNPSNSKEQSVNLTTTPSGDEGLQLALGDTAVLECQLRSQSSSYRFKSLTWTNTLSGFTMTTENATESGDKKMSDNDNKTTTTTFVMTLSNFSSLGTTPFRCDAEFEEEKEEKRKQTTLNVTLIDSEWFCTFEGTTDCGWQNEHPWKRKQSSTTVAVGRETCGYSIGDHTYGSSNTIGHYLIAEFDSKSSSAKDAILNKTVGSHDSRKCFRFFYRLCQRTTSNVQSPNDDDFMTVTVAKERKTYSVQKSEPREGWKEYSLLLQPNDKDYQIIITVKAGSVMYFAIDDIKFESNGICESAQSDLSAAEEVSEMKSTLVNSAPTLITMPATMSSSISSSSSSSPPSSSSSSFLSSASMSTSSPLTVPPAHPSTSEIFTGIVSTSTVSSTIALTSPSTLMQTPTAKSLTSPMVGSIKTTQITPTTLSQSSIPLLSSATLAIVSSTPALSSTQAKTITTKVTMIPDGDESSLRPTSHEAGVGDDDNDDDDDTGGGGSATADATTTDNSTGLAIGIILAIMVAGACTAAILYRRRKNGKKSTYITFGNPSYSREHLPVNDFGLDSPLTLSSNGYTVLA